MSFSVGIIGLPNVGKSTLFKALTKKQVDIAPYPFTTINPNVGIVAVPDKRLKKIGEIIKPEKITPTIIEFIDIAGLVKNAYKGEGLGNQFLSHIRECDAILEVVRAFVKDDVEHIEKNIEPKRDIEIIKTEFIMKDLETIEKSLEKLRKKAKSPNKEIVKKIDILENFKETLEKGNFINEQKFENSELFRDTIKESNFLTAKPILYIFNVNEQQNFQSGSPRALCLDFKLEEEISELSVDEKKELEIKSRLDELITACYNILDLITFYTIVGGKEARAWTTKAHSTAPQAGRCVHSDFEEKFIRATVIPWQKLADAKSWNKAKELGWLKTVGKDYVVQDGDVIEFKI